VLRRFVQKLSGRDPDLARPLMAAGLADPPEGDAPATGKSGGRPRSGARRGITKRQTPAEQVDALLREARSMDNLCRMYEGWTPWL
jgi:hypothetical protein